MYRRVAWAWLALCFALALHVWDEAAHNFLSIYNPNAAAIRASLPWLPIPQFTYLEWRDSLIVAVLALAALSVLVFRDVHAMRVPAMIFAGIMIVNGCMHIIGSLWMGRWMAGVYSSPLLLGCGVWLFVSAHLWEPHILPEWRQHAA